MGYTLGAAAKRVRKSKATLSKAIKEGRLSAKKNVDGHYDIDPSELHRVWPKVFDEPADEPSTEPPRAEPVNTGFASRIKQLETELKAEREKSTMITDQVVDLRGRLDASETERRQTQTQMTTLLTDQRPGSPWWRRWLG